MLDAAGRVSPTNLLLVATRVCLHSHEEETRVVYRGFVSFRLFAVSIEDSELALTGLDRCPARARDHPTLGSVEQKGVGRLRRAWDVVL